MFEHNFLDLQELTTTTINGKRHYNVGDKAYPSVTTVLGHKPKPQIEAWQQRIGLAAAEKIRDDAAARGTLLHELLENYLLNKPIDLDTALPETVDLFLQIKPVLDKHITNIYAIEGPLYSDSLGLAGRVDFIADFDGAPSIIDFKSSTRRKKLEYIDGYWLQTACYSYMTYERTKLYVPNLVVIIAVPGQPAADIFRQKSKNWFPKAIETINDYYISVGGKNEDR